MYQTSAAPSQNAAIDIAHITDTIQSGFPSLRFSDDLEEAYREMHHKILLKRGKIIAIYAILMLFVYCASDYAFLPESVHKLTIAIRLFVIAPVLLLIVWCAQKEWPYPAFMKVYTSGFVIGGLAIVAIIMSARMQYVPMPYEGIILITFLGYLIMGLPFYHALIGAIFLFFAYVLGELFSGYPIQELAYNAFFLLTANAIGAVGCYMQERTLRMGFLNSLLVERSRDLAEQENESKTRLLAAASHDLRQPLHAMTLFAENLEQKLPEGEALDYTRHIQSSVRHLNKLLSSLLDMSRLQFGVVKPLKKSFDLYQLTEQVIRETNQPESAEVIIQAGDRGFQVYTDSLLLGRILRNLVDNAQEHADAKHIWINFKRKNGFVTVSVIDDGKGISEQNLERIFDEFHQLDHRQHAGLGLGLSIVKQMSNLLELNFTVNSTPGEGTCFSLRVPLAKETEAKARQNIVEESGDLAKRILMVEDMPEVLATAADMLTSWGYQVDTAESVSTAQQLMKTGKYDLIVSDYHFEDDQTGEDLARSLREQGTMIPVIVLTADTQFQVDDGLMPIAVAFKPIKPAKLRVMLRQMLAADA